MRQLLTEGLLLGSLGGAIGVLLAAAAIRYFKAVNPIELPVGADIEINVPVLVFTVALSIASALIFGAVPAWQATRGDIIEVLKSAGRGAASTKSRQQLARTLLACEMALSVVLLVGAGLLMESVLQLGSTPLGFNPDNVITTSITLPPDRYGDAKRRIRFYDELERRLAASPAVLNAALTSSVPPLGGSNEAIAVQGRAPVTPATEVHDVSERLISRDYFRVFKTPLISGRGFDGRDGPDTQPVAVVNQALVRRYFPTTNPIGQRVRMFDAKNTKPWMTIVGVVPEEKHAAVYQEMNWIEPCILLRPIAQDPPSGISVVVRTAGTTGVQIEREIAGIDSNVPAGGTEVLTGTISKLFAYPRFRAVVFAGFAVFALLIAAIGLHGILRQFVIQHTQDIGVRIAIGARTEDILRLIAKQGGQPLIAGLVIGLAAATALSRYLSSLLYGVRPGDPFTLVVVSITLLVTAAAAMLMPTLRAWRVDPMVALRYE